ncbi:unnamed protein product [Haemonchus placei]|uniref:C-type lectin domain-containing protein n=1 Tax=Haemonchus placei TaxID=6290 RepID=A0A0N4X4J6_HAEPC|nr:unnamed protein product [Haemonchus placei]
MVSMVSTFSFSWFIPSCTRGLKHRKREISVTSQRLPIELVTFQRELIPPSSIGVGQVSCEPCEEEWTFVARVHSCYLAPHQPLTWHDAEEYCQRADANLVSINSAKESHYVRLLADQHNPQFLTWIGLSREENTTEAPFKWSDGSELSFTSFREGERMKTKPADILEVEITYKLIRTIRQGKHWR